MKKLIPFLAISLIIVLTSCNNDESKSTRLKVILVDSPASYDAVYVDVQAVNVRFGHSDEFDDQSDDSGWTDISDFDPQVFNLLELTNGSEAVLADMEVATGTLGEIRLVLGEANSLVMDGEPTTLTVPSGASSGLKIKLNAELRAGITYTLILDFDAARSIVSTGSGQYNLQPVIHARMDALTGAISGNIIPVDMNVVIYAMQDGVEIVSTYPDETGHFLLQALDAGTYDVAAVPEDADATITVEAVEVIVGDVTNAGTIAFE